MTIHKPCESLFVSNWQEPWGSPEFVVGLEERHSLLPCRWAEGMCLQLMLLHDVQAGICWSKVPLTFQAPIRARCSSQDVVRAASLSSAGAVQFSRQHLDISQATRVSSESQSCTVTFPDHGGPRNWAPDSFLRESTCYFWLVCKLSELCVILLILAANRND